MEKTGSVSVRLKLRWQSSQTGDLKLQSDQVIVSNRCCSPIESWPDSARLRVTPSHATRGMRGRARPLTAGCQVCSSAMRGRHAPVGNRNIGVCACVCVCARSPQRVHIFMRTCAHIYRPSEMFHIPPLSLSSAVSVSSAHKVQPRLCA